MRLPKILMLCARPLLLGLALWGCSASLPSTTQYPAPLASAAQPAATGRGDLAYARRGADAIRLALREYDDVDDALARVPRDGITPADSTVRAGCVGADGLIPVLICHYGPEAAQPVAQALFWQDREGWQSQLYPQAAAVSAAERREALSEIGCRLGCYSGVMRARQATGPDGQPELLVVVNLGFTGERQAEEVHLLRYDGLDWDLLWAPGGGDWNYGHARVEFAAKGLAQFKVHSSSWLRSDGLAGYLNESEAGLHRVFTEHWIRKGTVYVMANRREEPGPFRSLLRLIHYLSNGADEKAMGLLGPEVLLNDARSALAQKPPRQGWNIVRWGQHGYLLDTHRTGQLDVGVRFMLRGDDWVLAELWFPG